MIWSRRLPMNYQVLSSSFLIFMAISPLSCPNSNIANSNKVGTLYYAIDFKWKAVNLSGKGACDLQKKCDFCVKLFYLSENRTLIDGYLSKEPCARLDRTVGKRRIFEDPLPKNVYYVRIKVTDYDRMGPGEMITEVLFDISKVNGLSNRELFTESKLQIVTNTVGPSQRNLVLSVVPICSEDHYGPLCSLGCKPPKDRLCLKNGSLGCLRGWRGENCTQVDRCWNNSDFKCHNWATCRNVNDDYTCECDGGAGEQCKRGNDPCSKNRCDNDTECIPFKYKPYECKCSKGWIGRLCNWKDPCKENICRENCACKAEVPKDETEPKGNTNFSCECSSGNPGPKTSTPIFSPTILPKSSTEIKLSHLHWVLIAIIITILILIAIFALFRLYRKRLRQKIPQELSVNESPHVYRIAYNRPPSMYDYIDPVYDDPDAYIAPYLYDEYEIPYTATGPLMSSAEVSNQEIQTTSIPQLPPRPPSVKESINKPAQFFVPNEV